MCETCKNGWTFETRDKVVAGITPLRMCAPCWRAFDRWAYADPRGDVLLRAMALGCETVLLQRNGPLEAYRTAHAEHAALTLPVLDAVEAWIAERRKTTGADLPKTPKEFAGDLDKAIAVATGMGA